MKANYDTERQTILDVIEELKRQKSQLTEDLRGETDRYSQMEASLNMTDQDKLEFAKTIRHTEGQLKHMSKMY